MPSLDAAAEIRHRGSTPVSSSAIVTPRPSTPGTATSDGGPRAARSRRATSTLVEIDAGYATRTGIDAGDVLVALDERDRARVDERGEAVEHAREAVVGAHGDALQREPRDEQLLRCERRVRPRALAARADDAAGRGDALGERRRLEDDDDALAERDARPRADEPAPAAALVGGRGGCPALLPPVASSTAVAAAATSARSSACRGSARGVRIEAKITGVRDGLHEAGRRRDHRRVVGRERERRQGRVGERLAELRVRGDAADDGDPGRPGSAASRTRPTRARTIARW